MKPLLKELQESPVLVRLFVAHDLLPVEDKWGWEK